MKYKIFNLLPSYGTNTYLVWDEKSQEAMIIDPSAPSKELVNTMKDLSLTLKFIINTHCHSDHIGGNEYFVSKYKVPLYISRKDAPGLTDPKVNLSTYMGDDLVSPAANKLLNDKDKLSLGSKEIKIITTPGHTVGGICLMLGNLLFSGDTLFCESVGRSDLPGGNMNTLINSIKNKLFILPESTIVLPGHGPSSTIENEKVGNPFVGLAARM